MMRSTCSTSAMKSFKTQAPRSELCSAEMHGSEIGKQEASAECSDFTAFVGVWNDGGRLLQAEFFSNGFEVEKRGTLHSSLSPQGDSLIVRSLLGL